MVDWLNDIDIDKPVLLIGASPELKKYLPKNASEDFFTIAIGKSICAIDHVNILFSLDLVRIVHNISNFSERWDYYFVPHFISHHFWDSSTSGLFEIGGWKIEFDRKTGKSNPFTADSKYNYPLSPEHNKMLHHFLDFRDFKNHKGKTDCKNYLIADSLLYKDVDSVINFGKYNGIVKFDRDDISRTDETHPHSRKDYQKFLSTDGKLHNDCNSTHFALNWLWLKGVKEIHTVGISKDFHKWEDTQKILNLYQITQTRIEDK